MKFFIASPWKNKSAVEQITSELMTRGYDVYSFLLSGSNLTTGGSIADELKSFTNAMENWQNNQDIRKVFDSELQGIKDSDAIVLLEPAGHSSLLEAGIGYGMGKKIFVVGEVVQPEVFYLICEGMYPDISGFLDDLGKIAPK